MPLPFLLYGAASVIAYGLATYGAFYGIFYIDRVWNSKKKEIYLSILGPRGSGKTTIHNFLRNTTYEGATVGANSVQEIIIKNDETNQIITIKKGRDIAGAELAITAYYDEEIERSDIIFFVVDSTELLKDNNYKTNSRARLNFIIKKNNQKEELADIIIIISYIDKLQNKDNSTKNKVWETISDIANEGDIDSPFFANLMDNNDLRKLKNKLFE